MKGTLYINASTTPEKVGALKFGTFGAPQTYTTDEVFEIHGRLGSATESKPLLRVRNSAYSAGAMTTGVVTAIQAQAYGTSTNNVYATTALEAHTGVKGACTLLTGGEMRAGNFKCEDLGNNLTATGDIYVVKLGWQFTTGSAINGNSAYIYCRKEGTINLDCDAIIRTNDGSGSGVADYLINMAQATVPFVDAHTHDTEAKEIVCKVAGTEYWLKLYTA